MIWQSAQIFFIPHEFLNEKQIEISLTLSRCGVMGYIFFPLKNFIETIRTNHSGYIPSLQHVHLVQSKMLLSVRSLERCLGLISFFNVIYAFQTFQEDSLSIHSRRQSDEAPCLHMPVRTSVWTRAWQVCESRAVAVIPALYRSVNDTHISRQSVHCKPESREHLSNPAAAETSWLIPFRFRVKSKQAP